ncbi:hypothetical protein PAXRUDRAFT_432662 [Paxillus rubicundulus Ve08.2h10]|uniref:Uncharacterized protein n=1 Tax=Paxillus rubicundulus Ve08.2h10 TaxID=930991 RepID=A0A0D0D7U2_9AGAM|nr:hypothetical protein PAXRUDRAFT_432662 [Paxillus rubicundulus Ve08.2h10]
MPSIASGGCWLCATGLDGKSTALGGTLPGHRTPPSSSSLRCRQKLNAEVERRFELQSSSSTSKFERQVE